MSGGGGMTWLGQAVHVTRKDARFARWIIAGYVAVVIVGTAVDVHWLGVASMVPLAFLGVVLLGVLLLATVVQADSPADEDAFWVTRPLEPSAVLGAKILFALLVLLLPLAGQAVVLADLAVPPGSYPRLLAESALTFGSWLLMAGALAALTASLRTFAALLIGLTILNAFLGGSIPALVLGTPVLAKTFWLTGAMAIGWLLVLVHQYLTRRTRRGLGIAGAVFTAGLFLPLLGGRAAPMAGGADVPTSLRPTLEIARIRPIGPSLAVQIEVSDVDGAHGYILYPGGTRLGGRRGAPPDRLGSGGQLPRDDRGGGTDRGIESNPCAPAASAPS